MSQLEVFVNVTLIFSLYICDVPESGSIDAERETRVFDSVSFDKKCVFQQCCVWMIMDWTRLKENAIDQALVQKEALPEPASEAKRGREEIYASAHEHVALQ